MRIPKRYGQSKLSSCPFCGKQATSENDQGVAVCRSHKQTMLMDLKCACGDWLDVLSGKWGAYCQCMKCGNVNMKRALEMNPHVKQLGQKIEPKPKAYTPKKFTPKYDDEKSSSYGSKQQGSSGKKEITISSRDNYYFS